MNSNWMQTALLLLVIYLVVFLESTVQIFRSIFAVQPDLLPGLIIYAALRESFGGLCLAAATGGLFYDSFSSNPLGTSVLPLLIIGLIIHQYRELLVASERFSQLLLGFGAALGCPLLSLLFLFSAGQPPLTGWSTFWVVLFMGAIGGAFTPLWFLFFERLRRLFFYPVLPDPSFRPDREIARGRR